MKIIVTVDFGEDQSQKVRPVVRRPEDLKQRKGKRLTRDQVRAIRERHKIGISQANLRRMYNVSQSTISDVVSGKTWRNI